MIQYMFNVYMCMFDNFVIQFLFFFTEILKNTQL